MSDENQKRAFAKSSCTSVSNSASFVRVYLHNNGFTLVELLVVISIIALLLAILMPALQKARGQGHRLVCASHEKQYGLAVVLYATENTDRFLPYGDKSAKNMKYPAHETLWYNRLAKYVGGKIISPSDSQTVKDEKNEFNEWISFRRCPTGKAWIGVVYGAQAYCNVDAPFLYVQGDSPVIGDNWGAGFRHSEIRSPANWIIFIDTPTGSAMYTPNNWAFTKDVSGDGIADTCLSVQDYNGAAPRVHAGNCNITLADGHVEKMTFKAFQDPLNNKWKGRPRISTR